LVKKSGINRISIGLQSFKDSDLKWLNRAHNLDRGLNLSVDLIYGLPDLTLPEWKQHLQQFIELRIQYILAYCLTLKNEQWQEVLLTGLRTIWKVSRSKLREVESLLDLERKKI
jgi:coproporphyrinogen III oxidase-like Fe-S oxidoreductase